MKYLELKEIKTKFFDLLKTVILIIKNGKNVNIIFINGLWLEVYIYQIYFSEKKQLEKLLEIQFGKSFIHNTKLMIILINFKKKNTTLKIQLLKFLRNFTLKSNNTIVVPSKHLMDFVKNQGFKGSLMQINNGTEITEN